MRMPTQPHQVNRAAFFDLDGTLLPPPSLEHRFARFLRWRGHLSARNLFRWLGEAVRLAPRGFFALRHANKMYLRGLAATESGALRLTARHLRMDFFPAALDCVQWHAEQGHGIVILSGTLEFLAEHAARALEAQLAARGCVVAIHVCATRLESSGRGWTGRVLGAPMAGEAKARAAVRLAALEGFDIADCYAYGDSASDHWLLRAAGHAVAVNPSWRLARIARAKGWPILQWLRKRDSTQITLSASSRCGCREEMCITRQESQR
jgi:alcohol-forming fatty acyl-CoA reductase